jgi:hypothetical protein
MGASLHRKLAFSRNMELYETVLGHKVNLMAREK